MGKYFTNIIIIFLLSTSVCSQENQDIVPYNLKAALKSVLNNHKTILATKNDIKAAELRVKQSKGGYFPSLDVTANYGHENIIKYGPGNNTQLMARDATAKLTQTITDFGLTNSTVKTSKLSLKQGRLKYKLKLIHFPTISKYCLLLFTYIIFK